MDKWEYTYYKSSLLNEDDLLVRLNEVGKEGWELVQILTNTIILTFIFKRKILENNKPNESDIRSITSTLIKKFPHIVCSSRYSDKLMNVVISLKTFNIEDSEKDDLYDYLYSLRKELEMRYRDNAPLIDVDNEWIKDND